VGVCFQRYKKRRDRSERRNGEPQDRGRRRTPEATAGAASGGSVPAGGRAARIQGLRE
jgi:hypothetical protein